MKSSLSSLFTLSAALGLLLAVGCGPVYYVETDYYPEVVCPPGSVWDGAWCVAQPGVVVVECPAGTRWVNGMCVEYVPGPNTHCPRGTWFDGTSCVWRQVGCPPGYRYEGRTCVRGVPDCPRGAFFNGRRCVKGDGPTVACPRGTVFNGRRCEAAGGGKPGRLPPPDRRPPPDRGKPDGGKPDRGTVDTPPGKGMLPAAQCPPGQRWDPVARACVARKDRRPGKCGANERWTGGKCVAVTPVAPPRRPPATDKGDDGRPDRPVDRKPPKPRNCPPGQHLDGDSCVANPAGDSCPEGMHKVKGRCVAKAGRPKECPKGQRWNARSNSCVPIKRPPKPQR